MLVAVGVGDGARSGGHVSVRRPDRIGGHRELHRGACEARGLSEGALSQPDRSASEDRCSAMQAHGGESPGTGDGMVLFSKFRVLDGS